MTHDHAHTSAPAVSAPMQTAEVRVTNDELVVSGLNLAGPTRLVLHAGQRSLRVADFTSAGRLSVEQCHDEACPCYTTEEIGMQP